MEAGGITVCAIVKDERRYLIEWVAYYRLLGFDRVVIYSNDCSDGSDRLLDGMQGAGLIEHRPWPSRPGSPPQHSAYRHALDHCETRWILFVDADEFLHLSEDRDIHRFVARFRAGISAVAISWRIFGSSGHVDHDPAPVIERFTRAAPGDHPLNRHVKTMAVATDVQAAGVHGVILARGGYAMANGLDVELHRHAFAPPCHDVAQINHYVVKSRAEFRAKQCRGNAAVAPEKLDASALRDDAFFESHDRNEEEARAIQARLGDVKIAMRAIRRKVLKVDPGLAPLLRADRRKGLLRSLQQRAREWLRRRARRHPTPA